MAFCGYHGWHDWYLAANPADQASCGGPSRLDGHLLPGLDPGGVPVELAGTAFGFRYNRDRVTAVIKPGRVHLFDLDSTERIIA